MNGMTPCPCGSGTAYGACCGPLHDGAPAATAEALMRSRYTAFAVGDADTNFLSWQYTGSATTGYLTFTAPTRPGQYEFRYFLNDGFTRAATGNRLTVQ